MDIHSTACVDRFIISQPIGIHIHFSGVGHIGHAHGSRYTIVGIFIADLQHMAGDISHITDSNAGVNGGIPFGLDARGLIQVDLGCIGHIGHGNSGAHIEIVFPSVARNGYILPWGVLILGIQKLSQWAKLFTDWFIIIYLRIEYRFCAFIQIVRKSIAGDDIQLIQFFYSLDSYVSFVASQFSRIIYHSAAVAACHIDSGAKGCIVIVQSHDCTGHFIGRGGVHIQIFASSHCGMGVLFSYIDFRFGILRIDTYGYRR